MAVIPPFFLDCVVAIGFSDSVGVVGYNATGFLYGRLVAAEPSTAEHKYRVYLVTNRHVFENEQQAHLRFNPSAAGPAQSFQLNLKSPTGDRLWLTHADPDVDLAVIGINANFLKEKDIQYSPITWGSSVCRELVSHRRLPSNTRLLRSRV